MRRMRAASTTALGLAAVSAAVAGWSASPSTGHASAEALVAPSAQLAAAVVADRQAALRSATSRDATRGGLATPPTPSAMATPTADAAARAAATPGVAPIVGTFPPVPGCTAAVPKATPPNGRIAGSALCPIGNGHELRADAAATYVALDRAYAAAFGRPLCITDSYRSYGSQVSLYARKPGLAAVPGTSNHGWGIAVDVSCGVDSYGTPQYRWMTEHGPDFGWSNPAWARSGGSRNEPWHWEFNRALLSR